MKKLKVITWPDVRLKNPSAQLSSNSFTDTFREFCNNLHYTMLEEDGIGLAAPQVGVHSRVVAFGLEGLPRIMVNPVIVGKRKESSEVEGCLSLPGFFAVVNRYNEVDVEYQDEYGNTASGTFTGLQA